MLCHTVAILKKALQFLRWRFQYDIFISYRRTHIAYVRKLEEQLKALDFVSFFDEKECPPGAALEATIKKAVRRSAALVLVGTSDALDSEYIVRHELAEFAPTGRTMIPVDVGGDLRSKLPSIIAERDLVWIDETRDAFEVAVPSPQVAAGIEANFAFLKRNRRRRIEQLATAAVVLIISGGALLYTAHEVRSAVEQVKVARGEEDNAKQGQSKAERATQAAERERSSAERIRDEARTLAQEEQGRRAAVLASEPGQEFDSLVAGILGIGPSLEANQSPPVAARFGIAEALKSAVRSIPIRTGRIHGAMFTTDSQEIVTVSSAGASWFESESGRPIRTLPNRDPNFRPSLCPDARLVILGLGTVNSTSQPPTPIRLLESDTGQVWRNIMIPDARIVEVCSADRRFLAYRKEDTLFLWDVEAGRDIGPVNDLRDEYQDVSPEHRFGILRLRDGTQAQISRPPDLAVVARAKPVVIEYQMPLVFSRDGLRYLTPEGVWDTRTRVLRVALKYPRPPALDSERFAPHETAPVRIAIFSSDDRRIATDSDDGVARI
jgi:hypothetical protein